jgi:hypothetical protein|tara:strand:+ start:3613 stop:5766 length:2154 start_codon:yes stop_codon:yes gene_type:complete
MAVLPGTQQISPKQVYDYLMTKPKMTHNKAMGILANIKAESDFYIDAVEIGDMENKGIGLFQHTFKTRKSGLQQQVPDWKSNWKAQIDFALEESEAQNYLNSEFDSVDDAVVQFMLDFEKPQDQSVDAQDKRISYIQGFSDILNTEGRGGVTYKVYDTKTNKYTNFTSSYNTETNTWTHSADDKSYTQEEINNIANIYTSIGAESEGADNVMKEDEFEDGTKFYRAFFSEDGFEQTPFTKRFTFVGPKPVQLQQDPKDLVAYNERKQNANREKANISLENSDKQEKEQAKLKTQNELTTKVNKLYKTYLATNQPGDLNAYKIAKEELENFKVSFDKNAKLSGLVEQEKRLREQLAVIQDNAIDFSNDDIISLKKQIDKVSIEISEVQGAPRSEGPFGYTMPQLEEVETPEGSYGLSDRIVDSTKNKEIENQPEKKAEIPETIPNDFVVNLPEVEVKPEDIDEPTIKNDNVSNNDAKDGKGFWDSLGKVGDGLAKGLGLVKQITDMIGGPGTLVAATMGRQAYNDAMKEIKPLELPGLSDMFKKHLYQTQQLSKMGFTPEEAAKHRKDIDKAYQIGIENSVRGTAGDRAKFLATSGVLDAERSTALLNFAAKDAELQRINMDKYGQALNFKEEFEYRKGAAERADDLAEQIRNKQGASNFAQLAFQQVADNMNDQSSIYKNMFEQMLANKIQNNSNNPIVGLNTPGSSNTTTGSVNPN